MTQQVKTDDAPLAVGPYSQGITAGDLVFTAGELPVDPQTGEVPESTEDQIRQALRNVTAILSAANVPLNNVASVVVYLTDIRDFSQMNLIYQEFFSEPYPARSCVQVSALPKGVRIMVSAIGVKDVQ
ncbi:MAG: RidA family protein [Candidatus Methanomethylophilus sp.]|nr:RidA family protein [Methanomethylophilus sp.]